MRRQPPASLTATAAKGTMIAVEFVVNAPCGCDLRCESLGEDGSAGLPDPMSIQMRPGAALQNRISTDHRTDRFIASDDVEPREVLNAASNLSPPVHDPEDPLAAARRSLAFIGGPI